MSDTIFGLNPAQIRFLRNWWQAFGDGTPVPRPSIDGAPFADVLFLAERWEQERGRPVPPLRAAA